MKWSKHLVRLVGDLFPYYHYYHQKWRQRMNRIQQRNKEDFISFLKEVLDLFKWLCVAFTLAYFSASLANLDTNLGVLL